MRIGSLKLKNRIFLAPMEEINDPAFRMLCKKAGAGLTYTGLSSPLNPKELTLDDKPALQIFCTSEKGVKDFIKKYDKKVSLWDFNLGCPSKLAKKHGFGVFMHEDLESIEQILKVMKESTKKPVTIKIRKSPKTLEIIKIAEKYCDAIGIHPRTQAQGYSGKPDLDFSLKVKEMTRLPVIYSGDVNEKNYRELLRKFDFVMVGRAAIGRPNIFVKMTGKKMRDITFKNYLKLAEKYKLYFRQIKFQAMNFTKDQKDAKKLRLKIFEAKSLEELKKILLLS
ncbi:tRNA-dihydrouridine synthase B [uncultured archaeon]|nr:tRNA-dihydrouridine synthase B [uncultured archaeon]